MAVKRARKTTLEAFFPAHNGRRAKLIEARLQSIRVATPLTEDPGIVAPCRLHVLALVEQLRTTLSAINLFDQEIAAVASTLPDYALFQSLQGARPHLAPRLLAAFGEQRDRFQGAHELQKYSGIAPVTERSGKKSWVHWRWQCRRSCARHSLNGRARPSTNHSRPALTTGNSAPRGVPTKPPCGH